MSAGVVEAKQGRLGSAGNGPIMDQHWLKINENVRREQQVGRNG